MNKNKYISLAIALAAVASLAIAIPVFAQTPPAGGRGGRFGGGMGNRGGMPAVVGTVSAINGDSITVSGKQGFNSTAAATTYTVDATNATVTKNNTAGTISSIAVGDTIAVQGTVSGTNVTATNIRDGVMMGGNGQRGGMGIGGTVSAINGTSLTVTGKGRPAAGSTTATTVTYTVDASSATVTKNGAASSVPDIAVGDTIMVQGTVSGTSVTAKTIRDGVVPQGQGQPAIQGNGQPVVAGSVTAISGNVITITNKSNVTYTIDATNAKFSVNGVTNPTILNVTTGDNLMIQGTVNGTSVTASSVIDQKASANANQNNSAGKPKAQSGIGGFFGGIGNFFKHLFGF